MSLAQVKDWVLQIALALIIFFGFLRPYVVEAFRIPTPSMEQTLLVGDHLLVMKVEEGQKIPWTDRLKPLIHNFRGDSLGLLMPGTGIVRTGEILVFRYPQDMTKDFIKRAVAIAGDTIRITNDTLYVNGSPSTDWATCFQDPFYENPLDSYWPECLNDRRLQRLPDLNYSLLRQGIIMNNSGVPAYVVPEGHVFMMGDNRDHSNDSRVWGPLNLDLIKGEALVTYWSWSRGHGLPKIGRIARMIR